MPTGVYKRTKECRRILSLRFLGRRGEETNNWSGNNVGYFGLHKWIRKQLGTPKECWECGTKTAKQYHWANISKQYKRANGLKDWRRLCVSCHRKFDKAILGEKNHMAKLTEKDVIKLRKLYAKGIPPRELCKIFNTGCKNIHLIVKRKSWKHI